MPRTARLTNALRAPGRGKALALVGAAAALAGAGTVSAATIASAGAPGHAPAAQHAAAHETSSAHRRAAVRHTSSAHNSTTRHAQTAKHAAASHRSAPAQRAAAPAKHGPAKHARAKPAAAKHAAAKHAPARPVAARHPAALPARLAKPYLIYDSVTPAQIPAHHQIATYATGGYAVPAAAVAGRPVLWIDTNGSDPHAAALDVEPGDATPQIAAAWAHAKLTAQPGATARIYTMLSEWPAAKAAIAHLPAWMHRHIRWWIADPTGVPHIVPGAQATQWYWGKNYDITTAKPTF